MTSPRNTVHTRGWRYWSAMYRDQLRRKRLLHERYNRLHAAASEVCRAATTAEVVDYGPMTVIQGDALNDLYEVLRSER